MDTDAIHGILKTYGNHELIELDAHSVGRNNVF